MKKLLAYFIVSISPYQVQVPQSPQGGQQNSQQHYSPQDTHYVPQLGSAGAPPQGQPHGQPHGQPQGHSNNAHGQSQMNSKRRFPARKSNHVTAHNHNSDYRWEISGCYKPVIQAQLGFRQFLVSDSFPNVNPGAMNCIWRFKAPQGMLIKVTWRNFHLDNCSKSFLKIINGFDIEQSTYAQTYCGLKKPDPYVTTGRFMTMVLNNVATGSPLGVKLMMGFEAVVDPMGSVMTNPMMVGGGVGGVGVVGGVAGHDPSGSPTKRLVQVGKYSFKSEDSEQSTSESPTFDDETEKESISKRPIAAYVAGAIIAALILLVAAKKCCGGKKDASKTDETANNAQAPPSAQLTK